MGFFIMDFCTTSTVALAVFFLLVIYVKYRRSSRHRLPPGPTGLPIVGYLPFLTDKPHLKLLEIRKKYGPVFSVKLGSHNIVVLCDFKSIRDGFSQDALMGIPTSLTLFPRNKKTVETEAMCGVKWKEQRRFAMHLFKDLGFARTEMEEHLKEEICYVLDLIAQEVDQPLSMRPILIPSMSNNIASLAFGRRMKYDDPKRILLDRLLTQVSSYATQIISTAFFPWIRILMKIFGLGTPKKLDDALDTMNQFFSEEIDEHEKTLDPEIIRDFIDGYLLQIDKKKMEPNTTFIKPVLQDVVQQFFGAGSSTVRITVEWLLIIFAAFPDVQRRIQSEIDNIIGTERFPKYADYTKMPYTQAVLMETLRWRTTLPLNFIRQALSDTQVNSFFIPKGTFILSNQWAVHHDPALFSHPESFRPERFLTADGSGVNKPEYYMPFSIGRRSCPGESFAYISVFLYLTAILQKFNVKAPEGATVDLEGELSFALQPKEQEVIFQQRQQLL